MARNPEYWHFIDAIWANVTQTTPRLVFADWLEEHDMVAAGKRQRMYAEFIRQSECLFERMESARKAVCGKGRNYKKSQVRHVYGIIDRPKQGHMQDFEIKRDGRIVLNPPNMQRGITPNSYGCKLLSGRWLPPKIRSRYTVQGATTGRMSGTSPNPSNLPKSNCPATGGPVELNIHTGIGAGTPDAIANSQLFDYKTVRPGGEPLGKLYPHQAALLKQLQSIKGVFPTVAAHSKALAEVDYAGMEVKAPMLWQSKDEGSWGVAQPEMKKYGVIDAKQLPDTKEGWTQAVEMILNGIPLHPDNEKMLTNILGDLTDEDIFYNEKLGEPHAAIPSVNETK